MRNFIVLVALFFACAAHAATPLIVTQGDNAPLQFTATTDGTTAMDLTGASFEGKIKDSRGVVRTYANSHFTVTNSPAGQFTLLLAPSETILFAPGSANVAVRVTQSALPLTIHADAILLVRGYP